MAMLHRLSRTVSYPPTRRLFSTAASNDGYIGELLQQTSTFLAQDDARTVDLMLQHTVSMQETSGNASGAAQVQAIQADIAWRAGDLSTASNAAASALTNLFRSGNTPSDDDVPASILSTRIAVLSNALMHTDIPQPVSDSTSDLGQALARFASATGTQVEGIPDVSTSAFSAFRERSDVASELTREADLGELSIAIAAQDTDLASQCSDAVATWVSDTPPSSAPSSVAEWLEHSQLARGATLLSHSAYLSSDYDKAMSYGNISTQIQDRLTTPKSLSMGCSLVTPARAYGALCQKSGLAEHFMFGEGLFNSALRILRAEGASPILHLTLLDFADMLAAETRHESAAEQAREEARTVAAALTDTGDSDEWRQFEWRLFVTEAGMFAKGS